MKTPKTPEHLNVETLRKWLDDYESTWTEQDKKYLGEFKHTPIRALVDKESGGGIANAEIYEHAGLGFVIIPIVERDSENFICPKCNSVKWGTANVTEGFDKWIGHCHSDYGCNFKWHRETEDKLYLNN